MNHHEQRRLAEAYGGSYEGGFRGFHLLDRSGYRATGDPVTGVQRVSVPLTDIVLRAGPMPDVDVATDFMPISPISKYLFTIGKDDANDLVKVDTHRPAKADFKASSVSVSEVPDVAERYGYAYLEDRDTFTNSSAPWDIPAMAAMKARRVVLQDVDRAAADLVSDNANFGDVIVGDTWSANGTFLDQIFAAASYLAGVTGQPKSAFNLVLFNQVALAAQSDKLFLERRSKVQGATAASLADLAAYVGVNQVTNPQPIIKLTPEASPTYLFPNDAILYYPGQPSMLGGYMGGLAWARTFRLLQGAVMAPWFNELNTSWYFPFEMREKKKILFPTCAVRITNPG